MTMTSSLARHLSFPPFLCVSNGIVRPTDKYGNADAFAAGEYVGAVKVGKVNIDDNMQVANMYGVQSIPTLMIFKDGEVVERFVGPQPRARLAQVLDGLKA